jgi:hypothetical protein
VCQVIEQKYFLMRKNSTGLERGAWASPSTGDLYCGVCLRGPIEATIGAACALCSSQVIRQFTAVRGGTARSALAAIRAERRKRKEQRLIAAERTGNLLIMRAG